MEASTLEYKKKEDIFYLKQCKEKACLRIKGNRDECWDWLVLLSLCFRPGQALGLPGAAGPIASLGIVGPLELDREWKSWLDGKTMDSLLDPIFALDREKLEAFLAELEIFLELDVENGAPVYWHALQTILQDVVKRFDPYHPRLAISSVVQQEILEMLRPKTLDQLNSLRAQIELKLERGGPGVDTDYWYVCLLELHIQRARLLLGTIFKAISFRESDNAQNELQTRLANLPNAREEYDVSMEPVITPAIHSADVFLTVLTAQENQAQLAKERKMAVAKHAVEKPKAIVYNRSRSLRERKD
ncbi:hypothetical protein HDV03_003801 [Kappamyces sp. JEL0829]|nr:hypothetical protein HDV03_003801 [Kappamyces sp. JEL0829]